MKKKILVVDDEEKILEVIKSYLEKENMDVITVNNGKEALVLFDKYSPALIVLDLMLPDIMGEEICKIIRSKSRVPIIMLTAKVAEDSIINGLEGGADDYLTKPFSPRQLVARVKTVLRRSEKELLNLLNKISVFEEKIIIDYEAHEVRVNGKKADLTSTEYNLLTTLSKAPNKTFTRSELIDMGFNRDYDGFDRSVDVHIKNIRKKTDNNIIKTVYGVGYKFGSELNEN